MSHIHNLSMRSKLLVLVVPSLLAVLYFSITSIVGNWSEAQNARVLYNRAHFTLALNPAIESLQRERGLSAMAISTGFSNEVTPALQQQRNRTDAALNQLSEDLSGFENERALTTEMRLLLRAYRDIPRDLNQWRQEIDTQRLDRVTMVERYSSSIEQLTSFAPLVIQNATEAELTKLLTAFYLLTDTAEMAGRERATGAVYLSLDEFDMGLYQEFAALVGNQQGILAITAQLIGGAFGERIQAVDEQPDSQTALEFRNRILLAGAAKPNIPSDQWFTQTSARINVLYTVKGEIIEQVTAQADYIADTARTNLIIVSTVVSLLIAFVLITTVLIMRAINSQVTNLLNAIDYAMHNKDLSQRVNVTSNDELGRVGKSVNDLFVSFSTALKRIDQTSVQLATATEETSSTALQNTEQTERQQRQVEQVATATEEMSTTSEDISRNTQQVAQAADNATASKDKGLAAVRESATSVETLVGSVNQVGDVIRQLEERSGSITSVIEVIKNVAEQTNLLALNAAIEAARAGEHGRGFAVVADEVRTLASQTHHSTTEIEDMLSAFQTLTGSAYTAINESQAVAEATKEQIQELNSAFDAIDYDVSEIAGMATQIATAAEQQVAVTRDIAHNMESVSEASLLTLTGSQEISAVTEEQAKLARALQDLAIQFKTVQDA